MSDIIASSSIYPDMPYIGAVYEILVSQMTTIHCWASFLEQPDRFHEHHQLRIALKQLRYSLDAFSPILCDSILHCVDDIKQLQDALGKLHDIDVLIASIQQRKQELARPIMKRKLYEGERSTRNSHKKLLSELLMQTQSRRDEQFRLCVDLWHTSNQRDIFGMLRSYLAEIDEQIQEYYHQHGSAEVNERSSSPYHE